MASPASRYRQAGDWPAVAVAVGILIMLGAVLVTATARWTEPDLRDLLGALAPVLGVVTGAFVTYFFTRQATAAAQTSADSATKQADSAAKRAEDARLQLNSEVERARSLHNALSTALAMVDADTSERMRQDPTIKAVLAPRLGP